MNRFNLDPQTTKVWLETVIPNRIKWRGWQGTTRCPFPSHGSEDKHSSFSVNAEKGTWICHKEQLNGGLLDLARNLGAERPAFLDGGGNGLKSEENIVESYGYKDEHGQLSYWVLRKKPKGFLQARPDGQGGKIYDLRAVTPLPYHLPELITAIDNGEAVFVTEGEKDADTLMSFGFAATCNSGGAGKWTEGHSRWFSQGAEVVICPDADKPGKSHAEKVATHLLARGCRVKMLDFGFPIEEAHGKDVTDWIVKGHSREDFLKLVGLTGYWDPDQREARQKILSLLKEAEPEKVPETEIIGGLFPRGYVTVLFADPGAGKTWFTLKAASDLSVGGSVFNGFAFSEKPLKVLFVEGDCGKELLDNRIKETGWPTPKNLKFLYLHDSSQMGVDLSFSEGEGQGTWKQVIEAFHPDIVFLDTLTAFHEVDENDAKSMKKVFHFLRDISSNGKLAFVINHHSRKPKRSEANFPLTQHDAVGSSILNRVAGTVISIESRKDPANEDENIHLVVCQKAWWRNFEEFAFKLVDEVSEDGEIKTKIHFDFDPNFTNSKGQLVEQYIKKTFSDAIPFSRAGLIQGLGDSVSQRTVDRVLQDLVDRRKLHKQGYSKTVTYTLSDPQTKRAG